MNDKEFRLKQIKKLLTELDSLYNNLSLIGTDFEHIEKIGLKEEHIYLSNEIKILAKRLIILCKTLFESEQLHKHLEVFSKKAEVFLKNEKKLFSYFFDETNAEEYSEFTAFVYDYLIGFNGIWGKYEESIKQKVGLKYLENILRSTKDIVDYWHLEPKKETEISDKVKFVIKLTFPDYSDPHFQFQKMAVCYKPDILIQELKCAIEFKFVKSEKELTKCLEQILIDVEGYSGHPQFNLFYAVFYLKKGTNINLNRATHLWKENAFAKNWKPIFVEG